jgi:hypothetical protein
MNATDQFDALADHIGGAGKVPKYKMAAVLAASGRSPWDLLVAAHADADADDPLCHVCGARMCTRSSRGHVDGGRRVYRVCPKCGAKSAVTVATDSYNGTTTVYLDEQPSHGILKAALEKEPR